MLTIFRLYIVYTKLNPLSGKVYVGKASALTNEISESKVERVKMRRENAPHHKNKEGFEQALVVKITTDGDAARGYEQLLYEKHKNEGKIAEQNAPISERNPKKAAYLKAALALFGDVLMLIALTALC
jgi:hypothetical protein